MQHLQQSDSKDRARRARDTNYQTRWFCFVHEETFQVKTIHTEPTVDEQPYFRELWRQMQSMMLRSYTVVKETVQNRESHPKMPLQGVASFERIFQFFSKVSESEVVLTTPSDRSILATMIHTHLGQ